MRARKLLVVAALLSGLVLGARPVLATPILSLNAAGANPHTEAPPSPLGAGSYPRKYLPPQAQGQEPPDGLGPAQSPDTSGAGASPMQSQGKKPTPKPTRSPTPTAAPTPTPAPGTTSLYWGVSMDGVPWDMSKLTSWEQNVSGKAAAIVQFWIFWKQNGVFQQLDPRLLDNIRSHGSIPMISWSPEEMGAGVNQPDFQLIDIIGGQYDSYISQWASAAKAWGKPFFLRWAQEPDGDWFPWGEDANGNQRGQYVQAWQHVHNIFTSIGATNATWVWCPNVQWSGSTRPSYASLYPGDDYVDWSCLDGYNWGSNYPTNGGWISFSQLFSYSYNAIGQVTSKPLMLGEWGSAEAGGSKADWITDALSLQIPTNFPRIKAQVWYNYIMSNVDWRVESSAASSAAYRTAISSTNWRSAEYGALAASPIPVP